MFKIEMTQQSNLNFWFHHGKLGLVINLTDSGCV